MTSKTFDSRCKSLAKSGKPCQAAATAGGLCYFHANPNKASELGRIGGRSRRLSTPENPDPLPTLDNALAVRSTVARLITDVYAGKLHPKIAAGLAPLLNLQLRAIETADVELRVAKLEKQAAAMEAKEAHSGNRRRRTVDFRPRGPMIKAPLDGDADADVQSTSSEPLEPPSVLWKDVESTCSEPLKPHSIFWEEE